MKTPRLDRTLGPIVVNWIERELVHGPGDVQGQAIELDDEFTRFLLCAYEINDRGKRVINRGVFSRMKGRAKSEFGAMVVAVEALGPVRFNGWGHNGRPMGRPVVSPYIPCVSTEEGQATDNVYGVIEFMLKEGAISRTPGLDIGITRTLLPDGGKIQPVTAKASSKDGGKETFVLFDETHLFILPDLKRLHATIRRNLTKRKLAEPWAMETSTMYALDEGSVAEDSHDYAQKVAEGVLSGDGFLFDHRQGATGFKWEDDDQLRAAIREAAGVAVEWMDIERIVNEIRDPQTTEPDARRYYLNQPSRRSESWIDPAMWEELADLERGVPPEGTPIVIGFDGSYNQDATALIGWTLDHYGFVLGIWERPPDAPKDWIVPREEVHIALADAMKCFKVIEFAFDPNKWVTELDAWELLYGSPPLVTFDQTPKNLGRACARFIGDVKTKTLSHDGNPAWARHLSNAVQKEHRDGAYIVKDGGRNSRRKIDAALAGVIGYDRTPAEAPKKLKPLVARR